MKKYLIFSFIIISFIVPPLSQGEEFTQKDRERLIRLETKVEEGQKALQRQITDLRSDLQRQTGDLRAGMQRQTDDLRGLILWGFGILFGGMGLLIGFVIWDRRTALEPVAKKYKELEDQGEKYKRALKEYAKAEPKLAEILRSLNLL